jgi:phosphotransferase system HPr (HPr) family protein
MSYYQQVEKIQPQDGIVIAQAGGDMLMISSVRPEYVQTLRRTFVVNLEQGLHARPCALMVKTLSRFRSRIEISANGEVANGRSIMSLMALAAGYESKILFTITGEDAPQAMQAVEGLFENHFEDAYDHTRFSKARIPR